MRRTNTRATCVAGAASLLLLAIVPAPALAVHPTFETWRPGTTSLVSVTATGVQADVNTANPLGSACYCFDPLLGRPSVSGDGRFVAFTSAASNLVAGDTNGFYDVFVKDRGTGVIERVSVSSSGGQGNLTSRSPSISHDGRYVAFASAASNLVPGDTNGGEPLISTFTDIFLRDRLTDTTELISLTTDEQQTVGRSGAPHAWADAPAITGDGRYVAFTSNATNLAPGAGGNNANGVVHVYVRDRVQGVTELASSSTAGVPGSGFGMSSPSISDDGRRVAFASVAPNLVPQDTGDLDVFVKDMESGAIEIASVSSAGEQQNDSNYYYGAPSLSADGRFVAFSSGATNLVPNDSTGPAFLVYGWNAGEDVFVRDLVAKTTERVSVGPAGQEYNWDFREPQMSGNGRYIASFGSAVYPDDPHRNAAGYYVDKVFVHDRLMGTTEVISVDDRGDLGNDHSRHPAISGDGRVVGFSSYAPDLTTGDANGIDDIFVRDQGPEVGVGRLTAARQEDGIEVAGWASFAGATIDSASDPKGDGSSTGPVPATDLGAELTGARLLYRPERADALLAWDLAALPTSGSAGGFGTFTPSMAGRPGITYGMRFTTTSGTFEVRVVRTGITRHPGNHRIGGPAPYAALFFCEVACVEVARLDGGIGTAGAEVRAALPLSLVAGLAEGAMVTGATAFTALGESAATAPSRIDEVALGDASVPVRSIRFAAATPGTPEGELVFGIAGALEGTTFRAILPGPHPVPADLAVKTCLGERCHIQRTEV